MGHMGEDSPSGTCMVQTGGFVSHVEVLLDPFNHVVPLPAGPGAALILML